MDQVLSTQNIQTVVKHHAEAHKALLACIKSLEKQIKNDKKTYKKEIGQLEKTITLLESECTTSVDANGPIN